MKYQTLMINLSAFLISLASVVSGGKILTEKPDYLQPCKVSDSSFSSCYARSLQVMFGAWKNGVPGLRSVGGIDPLRVKRISIAQPPDSPISLTIVLSDIVIDGLSRLIPKESSFDTNKLTLRSQMLIPQMDVQANYEMQGNIVNLLLNGKGTSTASIYNAVVDIAIHFKIRKEADYIFTDVDKIRVGIGKIDGARFRLNNLFNGDKALEDSANAILNENWEALFEFGRPGFNEAFAVIMKDRLSKVYAYIPGTYFFEDLPTGA